MATMDLTNEVVRLRAELEKVSTERDMLLCEVSNLRRELELSELKNLQDDSFYTLKIAISRNLVCAMAAYYSIVHQGSMAKLTAGPFC
ncbi:unnamed protein product [Pieris macdunnoughi]|uniref:Uncharacterized protein n=1 Tax=Pieris macdunnoughi TaxID=345717 RepID=A0A821YCG0_9NEOP|nr:unnamed protein product [Pieris macdunnoughi]